MHRFPRDNTRCFDIRLAAQFGLDWTFAIQWVAQTVNNTTQQFWTDRNVHNRVCTLDCIAFFDVSVRPENNNTNVVRFQVQRHPLDTAWEFDHFTSLNIVQTEHARDTIPNGKDAAHFGNFSFLAKVLNLVF